jgi:hypothetical protein
VVPRPGFVEGWRIRAAEADLRLEDVIAAVIEGDVDNSGLRRRDCA